MDEKTEKNSIYFQARKTKIFIEPQVQTLEDWRRKLNIDKS